MSKVAAIIMAMALVGMDQATKRFNALNIGTTAKYAFPHKKHKRGKPKQ